MSIRIYHFPKLQEDLKRSTFLKMYLSRQTPEVVPTKKRERIFFKKTKQWDVKNDVTFKLQLLGTLVWYAA